jgi:hypothetical protein
MKEEYTKVQEKKLASGLKDELNYLIGSPNKFKQRLMGQSKMDSHLEKFE